MNKTQKRRCPHCLSAYWIKDRCALCGYDVNHMIRLEQISKYEREITLIQYLKRKKLVKTIRFYSLITISLILFLTIYLNLTELALL